MLFYAIMRTFTYFLIFVYSHTLVNGAGNHFVLLFFGEFIEVDGVARYANGELRIFFGMFLRVQQRFAVEYVYVQMMSAVRHVRV